MRARLPDESGYVVNDGVRVYYEKFGAGTPAVVFTPIDAIVHSRAWKAQVPYLARRHTVVTIDPRGNGRSDRPADSAAYADTAFVSDTVAVMDAVGIERAVLIGLCTSGWRSLLAAVHHPERVLGVVSIASWAPYLTPPLPARASFDFEAELDSYVGWDKTNRKYWLENWRDYVEFFFGELLSEPHSTKQYEDAVGWALEIAPETMIAHDEGPTSSSSREETEAILERVSCPVLCIHGDGDRCQPHDRSARIAEITGGELLTLSGVGHLPQAREPVVVNHAIGDFLDRIGGRSRRTTWSYPQSSVRRALWISSPIGLGHVQRDIAIAREVRRRVPELEIHWWAQPPVTDVLAEAGEIIHPVSAEMASESAHWESEARNHDLHAFYALRRMDEIFCANYMLFDDVVRDTRYDLWAGDECWEVDYYLHENPERKIAPYAFMTDVIGFLPTDAEADPREAELCADYNADSIEKRERYPSLRDVSMFIGSWDELPDASFGPGLPRIRPWSRRWFSSVPYVLPFDPGAFADRTRVRAELEIDPDAPLIVSTVGGTAVGVELLGLVADAFGRLRKEQPGARMVMITGPRIDPRSLPDVEGMDKYGYVPDVVRYLAACDAAVVQGGLSTTMELVGLGRPFIYFPLAHHFEQQHFVSHRLRHHRAGSAMNYATTTSEELAGALRATLEHQRPRYRRIPPDGTARAADQIVPLLTGRG